jgi:glucose/arabinose dehydrogenase
VDSGNANDVPLLGNRVDRFLWNGSTLTMDDPTPGQPIIRLRAWQPPNPPFETNNFTNHNGGVIHFGPDGKLYVFIGDNGRRGFLQNILVGHGQNGMDDQFGGPEPDDAHLTGVMLRLNDDGSTPTDNPFFNVGAQISEIAPEVGANIQKIFSYGHRNGFGFAFDPFTGSLWMEENGDNSYTEINRDEPGMNGGWIMVAGPISRVADFKAIETGRFEPALRGLQQNRFSPDELPDTPEEAMTRMFQLEGSHYSDPEFSWRFEVAPAGVGFLNSTALGERYLGNFFVGGARVFLAGGPLFRFQLNADRTGFAFDDPRLQDLVADNNFTAAGATAGRYDITESESLLFGFNFGIATDIETGPNGHLFVVSLSDGAVYEIRPKATPFTGTAFTAILTGSQEAPTPNPSSALAIALFELNDTGTQLRYRVYTFGLDLDGMQTTSTADDVTGMHIHRGAAGVAGPIIFSIIAPPPSSDLDDRFIDPVAGVVTGAWDAEEGSGGATLTSELGNLLSEGLYINIHTTRFPGGEVRGQIRQFV